MGGVLSVPGALRTVGGVLAFRRAGRFAPCQQPVQRRRAALNVNHVVRHGAARRRQRVAQLGGLRHVQPQRPQAVYLAEHLFRRALQRNFPLAHHDYAVGRSGLLHIVRDLHHRDAEFAVQPVHRAHHLFAADGVEHRGGLVQHKAIGPHGHNAGNGHALLLPAR